MHLFVSVSQNAQLDNPTDDPEEMAKPEGPEGACSSQCTKVRTGEQQHRNKQKKYL